MAAAVEDAARGEEDAGLEGVGAEAEAVREEDGVVEEVGDGGHVGSRTQIWTDVQVDSEARLAW